MKWIKQRIKNQWVDHSGVVPTQRWSEKDRAFFFNSSAGLLKFKPKNEKDLIRFRDKYVNQFDSIMLCGSPELQTKMFFLLYSEIRKKERVKYRANVRTRLRGRLWSFVSLL